MNKFKIIGSMPTRNKKGKHKKRGVRDYLKEKKQTSYKMRQQENQYKIFDGRQRS